MTNEKKKVSLEEYAYMFLLSKSIKEFNLDIRSKNALTLVESLYGVCVLEFKKKVWKNNEYTYGTRYIKSKRGILGIRNIGNKSIEKIKDVIFDFYKINEDLSVFNYFVESIENPFENFKDFYYPDAEMTESELNKYLNDVFENGIKKDQFKNDEKIVKSDNEEGSDFIKEASDFFVNFLKNPDIHEKEKQNILNQIFEVVQKAEAKKIEDKCFNISLGFDSFIFRSK